MKRTKEDIYQNETHPEIYLKREREIRFRKIEDIVGVTILLVLSGIALTIVQVAYGIW